MFSNALNGSWGIFKILPDFRPKQGRILTFPQLPLGAFQYEQAPVGCRLDLNLPPTPVGGIHSSDTVLFVFQQPARGATAALCV